MHRTERKTEQARQPEGERRQDLKARKPHPASEWAETAEAILAGAGWEQLPAERILSLSGAIGNTALNELFAHRKTDPETAARPLPRGEFEAAPVKLGELGEPLMVSPPYGGSADGLVGNIQPLTLY